MSRFVTKPTISPVEGTSLWILEAPLVYESDLLGETVTVPAGFVYDGNSIPDWLRLIPIVPFFIKDKIAFPGSAALHDYGYRYKTWPRATTDALYREALAVEGASKPRRFLRWLGVRIGGWTAYGKKDGEAGRAGS